MNVNITVNETASMGAASGAGDNRPAKHRSSQISAGPQYVADVLGRFGAEPATDAGDAAPVVLGYN
ncbi:molecular chaperone [Burkholderia stabilis]|uniref:Molecular chaperone n=1 Tax=Burkholderia stabilis TaxID=95485 RepID=A0A1Y1BS95_9BURK|nr:molecular chaperone [Burkholderia stabilis]